MTDLAVLVPYRVKPGSWREQLGTLTTRLWGELAAQLVDDGINLTVVRAIDTHDAAAPFNRSAALNRARAATAAERLLVSDADDVPPPRETLLAAWRHLDAGRPWAAVYRDLRAYSEKTTRAMVAGGPIPEVPDGGGPIEHCGNVLLMTAQTWDSVGGFDEGFVGWGSEDDAYFEALKTLVPGGVSPGVGTRRTLWHPKASRTYARANGSRLRQYRRAAGDPVAMASVVRPEPAAEPPAAPVVQTAAHAAYTPRFYARIRAGAQSSAREVVPLVVDMMRARLDGRLPSVLDVGCGEGWWAREFAAEGCPVVRGVDGPHVAHRLGDRFIPVDLDQPGALRGLERFDLAVCVEVAEHLPPERAEGLVADLVGLAPVIVWSAAVPGQGGTGHVNEQWPSYWAALFAAHGYGLDDSLRRAVWQNEKVEPWYRQNLHYAVHNGPTQTENVLHPWYQRRRR